MASHWWRTAAAARRWRLGFPTICQRDLPARFAERVLPIDQPVAERWGDLTAHSRRSGVALSVMDGFFAATAIAHGVTLVTRNVKDFAAFGVPLLDSWDEV